MQLAITSDLGRVADELDLATYVVRLSDGRCVFASARLVSLLPPGGTNGAGDPVLAAAHPDDRAAVTDALAGLPAATTLRIGAEGGPWRTVTGHWTTAEVDGSAVVVGVLTPEPAGPAGDQLDQLSHDLRTPLNAVLGYAQLLGLTDLQPDQRNSVEQVIAGGRRLLGVIERLETAGR